MDAVDEELIQETEVQAPAAHQQQNYGQFVLEPQKYPHAEVLHAEEGGQGHPEQRSEKTAAKVQEEADESIYPTRLQVQVEVIVLGAHELRRTHRPAGGVHAGGVGAMEGTHPPRNGDHRH